MAGSGILTLRAEALRGHGAMLLFSALVAGSFPLGAAAANDIAPLALNAVRFWVAAGIVGIGVALTGGARGAGAAPWRYIVLGTVFATYFVLMFEGLKTAAPVSAAAVFTLTPVMAAGFGWLLLRQVTTPRIAGALALGALGALWVIFDADWAALRRFEVGRGEWIYLAGCAAHALYTPLVRMLNRGERAAVFTFGTLVAGACVVSLVGAPALAATDWSALPPRVWVAIGYTAVFASAATFTLLQFATLRLPAAKVMAYTYLVPAWVTLWSLALGQPAPPLGILVGVALTVGALGLLLKAD
ncbi:DMT family transporter [Jannaschia aquimarina]|uniref:EamA-like transporter family protein n=2 Tax=Jannaschia aquimarina TaxID=935700 RepID=A0A0D1ECS7_9RHOB|nr:DMT family transporter [Jannaschia aquimarina]KIT14736.1 EamA-like transporter family protein [Jannaschia aquimarina]SNS76640.1 EamA-like transporter family protein [Jannaschia aquimarina]